MFEKKLKKAMQDLNLKQSQVAGMTGKSKGSISQYLSGKQVPSEDVQRDIAVSLGLDADYFTKPDDDLPCCCRTGSTEVRCNQAVDRQGSCNASGC